MKVSETSPTDLAKLVRDGALLLNVPPFVVRIRSDISQLSEGVRLMYGEFEVLSPNRFADFHVEIRRRAGPMGWLQPHAEFYFDDKKMFTPLPTYQAITMLEWGLNWCIAAHCHQYLIIHAAAIERNGKAAILPARPGSGKSTLCAALIHRGWRLLSDELALYDMDTGMVYGMARPVNLKNQSIPIVQEFAPQAIMTQPVPNTAKGTVALMAPPPDSVARVREPAVPTWIVHPQFEAGSSPLLTPTNRARALVLIAEQSYNYDIHGVAAFEALGHMLDQCGCFQLTYSRLDDARQVFDELAAQ